jgi:acetylornithine/N-succinyldiaminopimelate aminotransferase
MSINSNEELHRSDQRHYLQAFKRYPIVLEKGQGAKVWDVEGNEYLDLLAGIAVNSVGHNHPTLVKAICEQASKLIHISNFYLSEPQAKLSEKLTRLADLDRVFFANSGAEANEGAFKIARKYAHSIGRGGDILSFKGSFHGRTLATIASGKKQMQEGFGPMPEGFRQIEFNDIEAVKKEADENTAAIIIEPIQGEGGINVADAAFLKSLKAYCTEQNIILIFDEIQCGMGRTGKMFAKEHYGINPDIMTVAKAMGGGFPVGAILSNEKVSSAIDFGDHGTTFGGNPLACAASLATLSIIEEEGLLKNVKEKSAWLQDRIRQLEEPRLKEIRGMGLMLGIEFDFETKELVMKMLQKGVLVNATAGNVLRLVPPLNIGYDDLEIGLNALKESLKEV